ncbi:MAG: hypothetical protein V7754_08635 [Halioglobus sp.]
MKVNFKPLGLAAAVAAATAGYTGVTQAALSDNGLGDLAIVPYYTVQGDFITGLHVINTSNATQVVKLRFRRASDSMDALDFNLIMSPRDEWTGFISDASGNIIVESQDNTCTVPFATISNGQFPMNPLYREGAEEGYIEVIGMGQAAPAYSIPPLTVSPAQTTALPGNPINAAAKHGTDGIPANCAGAETNFFRVATAAPVVPAALPDGIGGVIGGDSAGSEKGVYDSNLTMQRIIANTLSISNTFVDTPNVLKVSYFIRDAASGLEFGSDAVHIADFSADAMMTNQEQIAVGAAPDYFSFLFPDLDGGSPVGTLTGPARGKYDSIIRQTTDLGGRSVINDWSVAAERNVSTDWVVTMPGQYLMLDLQKYTSPLITGVPIACLSQAAIDAQPVASIPADIACDQRDIPVVLASGAPGGVWDREEQTFTSPEGGLVISPDVGIGPGATTLPYEVNVIEWTNGENLPVLDSAYFKEFDVAALGADFGWAELSVSSDPLKATDSLGYGHAVFDFTTGLFTPVTTPVPVVGFVAWERSFPEDPSANYGRIVDHSYGS